MLFKKKRNIKYELSFNKLEFVNAMSIAANMYRYLIKEKDGRYFLYADLIHRLHYRQIKSKLKFECMLKVPVDLPFENMDGIQLLRSESDELKANIKFEDATVVVMECASYFYVMSRVLKKAAGYEVEEVEGIIGEFEVSELGFHKINSQFKSKDEVGKTSWRFEEFKKGFINREFISKEYKRFLRFKKRVNLYFKY